MDQVFYHFYLVMMILSLVGSLTVIVLSWQRRNSVAARVMMALATATFIWSIGFFLEVFVDTLAQKSILTNVGYIGSMSVPVCWLVFSLHYTGKGRLVRGWRLTPLLVIPAVTLALIWTNDAHFLMWSDEHLITSGAFVTTTKTYGAFFWIAYVHNYVLMFAGAVILIRRLFVGTPLYTGQVVSLIVATGLPLIWNFIYVFRVLDLPRKDLTPAMFAISAFAITLGLLRFRLFQVVPFAHKFIIRQLNDGILVFDNNNHLVEANPVALDVIGGDGGVIGQTLAEFASISPLLERISSMKFSMVEVPVKFNGDDLWYELQTMPMKDASGQQNGWLALIHNITERKKMQEQLISQDRLVSIGELTSGIAHEINNPLTSIIVLSELLLARTTDEKTRGDLSLLNSEAERTAKIVNNLLTFARKQPENKLPVDINEIIRKTLELRTYDHKVNNIRTIVEYGEDLPEILANAFQIQQVFFNIIINAEFFMVAEHKRGLLSITTSQVGNMIRAVVTDDGPGISGEQINRIFGPFYTTKEIGKGTGLGLSICHGIITEHGGKIWVESEPGKGAAFNVELPVYSGIRSESPPE